MMTSQAAKLSALFFLAAVVVFAHPATAQQITYYDFDALVPSPPLIYSYSCGSSISAGILFCFNPNGYAYPDLFQDTYPASVDPNQADNPPVLPTANVSSISRSSGMVTATVDSVAGFVAGGQVQVSGVSDSSFDGSFSLGAVNTSPNTLQWSQAGTDATSSGGTVVATHATLQITTDAGGEGSSAWFAVPQKVLNGFTAYVAFRLTPGTSPTSADGIAFVIQNAAGGGSESNSDGSSCFEAGSGLSVFASGGGCIGYGGIDNSLAIEFDTYQNGFDPNNNHIAIQSCGLTSGVGNPNSPDHNGSCQVKDQTTTLPAIKSSLPITLADGNVHQAVIEYSGAAGATANQWQVFIDPVFISGTHTPDTTQSTAVITTTADLTKYMTLQNSGSANDSAYVGFTAGTGLYYENQEILAWTFTPHTPVTQPQPLQPAGSQTTFPFGSHTYAVTYPSSGPSTSGIDMVVIANTINPTDFVTLIAPTPFVGSQCQVYDGTGGNCVIYSVYCVTHGTTNKVACPATSDSTIAVKTAYESDNTVTPPSPGFLQGDPFFSPISSITGNGTTATVSCTGECAITVILPATTQSVTIAGNSAAGFNGSVNATPTGIDTFTFPSATNSSGTGGFVTSNNLINICNGASDTPPCWQAAKIDGTTAGRTKNFSDLVALSTTISTVNTTLSISALPISYGSVAQITVSVAPVGGTGPVTGNVTLTVDGNSATAQTSSLTNGSASFTLPNVTAGPHSLSASYAGATSFAPSSTITPTSLIVNQATPVIMWTPASIQLGYPLTAAQLNASASAQGTSFVYSPPAGTVVNTTSQTVSVTFTPTDTVDYTTAMKTVSLTVTPGPLAMVSPTSINFETVYLGTITTKNVTLTNTGNAPMTVIGNLLSLIRGGDSKEFVEVNLCPKSLAVGKSCTMTIAFIAGPYYNLQTATLNIMDNAPGNPQTVALSATVINPQAKLSANSLNFGTQKLNTSSTKTVTLTSSGNTPLLINNISISGATAFTETNNCAATLNTSCTVTVKFAPSSKQSQSATLKINDNALSSPQDVALSGNCN
jgi:hypothetical protein